MDTEFVLVYTASQHYQALLIKGLLDENNIEASVINKQDSEFLVGFAEVFVKAGDKDKALEIIANRGQE
jgi:Tfp pilus assembly protein FimV